MGPTGQPTRQTASLVRCFEWPICDPPIHKHCLCIFHCLVQYAGLDGACTLETKFWEYFHCWLILREGHHCMEYFPGPTMDEVASVESKFSTGFNVYTWGWGGGGGGGGGGVGVGVGWLNAR